TSVATFKMENDKSSGISFSGELGALAGLAGFQGESGQSSMPIDQVTGRVFIEKIDAKLNFQLDPYFNTYDPKSVDPIWKSYIKRAIGWQKSSTDAQEAMWQGIVNTFSKSVVLEETPDGSAKVVVTHVNPQRAAEIANVVMDVIISNAKNKKNALQDQQLSYLSNTLAKALSDLEVSESNLKKFALENSALPLENFAAGYFQLDALRKQLKSTTELHEAVVALLLILQNKTLNQNDYVALRQQFPIVDRVEFRRVLGQNEIISSWSWPEISAVETVLNTLSERKSRLKSQINTSQINAERSGLTLENYAKLEREAKIAEATYTVLIEQVKAQSMAAGYRPDSTEIYEYASPSINPSAPKRSLILPMGALVGIFVGILLSLVWALRRGVYFSRTSLKTGAQARLTFSVKTLLPLRNKSLNDINAVVVKKPLPILRDIAVEIHKSCATQVVVTSSRSKVSGNDTALALASYMQSETIKVAVINFSSRPKRLDIDYKRLSDGSFVVIESADHVSVLSPDSDLAALELLAQRGFWESIQSLNSTFDLVFLSADNGDAITLLNALEGQKAFHILLARTKKTKSAALTQMRSRLPIQGLLHD
ncbi:hypothetical protein OAV15_04280, partial [Amylibacter sp.]|nr:hypothetical protein [Amylibacter sp.]